jgi:hypothetical protein
VPKAARKAAAAARPGPFVSATAVRGAARDAAPSLHAVEDPALWAAEKLHEVNAGDAARTQLNERRRGETVRPGRGRDRGCGRRGRGAI